MTAAAPAHGALLIAWIIFLVLALIGGIAVLVWAVRSRQFSNQDRARYLPLQSEIPEDENQETGVGRQTSGEPNPSPAACGGVSGVPRLAEHALGAGGERGACCVQGAQGMKGVKGDPECSALT
jgi:cbb3-type cytochrome oxidase maturation protein